MDFCLTEILNTGIVAQGEDGFRFAVGMTREGNCSRRGPGTITKDERSR